MTYPAPPPPAPMMPPKTPSLKPAWYRRGWVLALAALIVGIGIGSAGGSSKKTAAKTVAGPTTTATATVNVTTTLKPTQVIATKTVQVRVIYTPPPVNPFSDGQYLIGREVPPGTYHTKGGTDCYYARLNSLTGGIDDIIVNDNFSGPTSIEILGSDKAIQVSGGCEWSRIG